MSTVRTLAACGLGAMAFSAARGGLPAAFSLATPQQNAEPSMRGAAGQQQEARTEGESRLGGSVGTAAVALVGLAAASAASKRKVAMRATETKELVWTGRSAPSEPNDKYDIGVSSAVPFGQPKELPSGFAGGLVGSEYHGWGTYEWDPLQLAARYPEHLPWYREAELKHGRIAMLAVVGLLATDLFRIPGETFDQPGLNNLTAHKMLIGPGLGEGPMWYLMIVVGAIESLRFKEMGLNFEKLTLENAGDLNFGKGFLPKTEEGARQLKVKELKNGRLAMIAVGGMLTQMAVFKVPSFPFVPPA